MPSRQTLPTWGPRERPRTLLLAEGHPALTEQTAEEVRRQLSAVGDIVFSDLTGQEPIPPGIGDFAVVLGGDESILRAANRFGTRQMPILGVNVGKLGFLAPLSPAEFMRTVAEVAAGECTIVHHLMFDCRVIRQGQVITEQLGLNETAVLAGPPHSMLDIELLIDDVPVTTYSCDGLLISTPVGSTAHSLSAGGPILEKSINAFVICSISPHTLTVRPLVDSADHVYELRVQHPTGGTSVVVDGRTIHPLQPGDRVRVQRAEPEFQLIEVAGRGYYRTLREKLGWGGQIKGREA